jgi:predicted transposase/invertase (TIGR01784 family)
MSATVTLMIFINPKTDFAFKKIFGSEQSKGILISFLNGILYAGDSIIQDLTILDPYQAPKILGIKSSYLDVKAKLYNGSWVIIEMQVLNVEGFEKRVLYNATKTYSAQLSKGDEYEVLNPVIALTITDFQMFDDLASIVDQRPISRFVLKEKQSSMEYPSSDLELVFVELPKFKIPLSDLETLTDKWIYFLQNAKDLSVVPENMGAVAEIRQAFDIANQAGLTREELDLVERQLMYIQDQRGALTYATRVSKEEGRKEGREDGGKDMQRLIAQRLLPTLDDETISQTTGLSLEEIRSLRG